MKISSIRPSAAWVAGLVLAVLVIPLVLFAQDEARLGRLFRQAEREFKQGNVAEAEEGFLSILRGSPYHFNSHLALGRLYEQTNPEAALEHLNKAREIRPGSYQVHYRLGVVLEGRNLLLDAAEAYRQTIRLNASHRAANGRLRGILRRLRERQSVMERASQQFWVTPSLATLTLFGRVAMEQNEPRQALWEFESMRSRLPHLPEVNLWVARAQRRLGSLEGEIEAYRTFLEGNREADGVRLILLERLVEAWEFRKAAEPVALLETRLRDDLLEGKEAGRFFFLNSRLELARGHAGRAGELLRQAGRSGHEAALVTATFRDDLTLYPNNPALWMAFAHWLADANQRGQAAEAVLEAGKRDPALREQARQTLRDFAAWPQFAHTANLALGELALSEGDLVQAEQLLGSVPPGQREDRRASLLLGLLHQKQGKMVESLEAVTRYVFSFPDRQGMTFARGNVFWEMGRHDAAVALWQMDLGTMKGYPRVLSRVAEYLEQEGRTQQELETRQWMADAEPKNLPNRIRLGELLFQQDRKEEAVQAWEKVVDRKRGDFPLLVRLARAYLSMGDVAKAGLVLQRAAQVKNLDPALAHALAQELVKRNKHEAALKIVQEVYLANPDDPDAGRMLPELVLNAPAPPELRLAAARIAQKTGRSDLAIDILEQMVSADPTLEEGRFMLAGLYLAGNEAVEAERVILAGPAGAALTKPEQLHMLADAQSRQNKEAELANTLLRLQAVTAADPARDRKLGLLLARFGRAAEALPLLQKVLAENPTETALLLPVAKAELATQQTAAALIHLQRYLETQPDDLQVRALIIRTLLAARNWKELRPHLEFWVAGHPADGEARYNLITVYLREFETEKARPHYHLLLQSDPRLAALLTRYFPPKPEPKK